MAKTSKTPGRTQQINFFLMNRWSRLVDLPGYGYAKVPEATKRHWGEILAAYIAKRKSLQGLVLIVDIRRGLLEYDMRLLEWSRISEMPVHLLLNKSDKLSRQAATRALGAAQQQLDSGAWSGVSVQLFSAQKKSGVEALEIRLNQWLRRS